MGELRRALLLRALRTELGRLAGQTPVPDVVVKALGLVEEHQDISEEGIRALLHAARLSEGQATRSLVLALAGLYGLIRPCNATELADVTAVLPSLRAQGVISCDVDWTSAQRRELRGRGAVRHEQWLVAICPQAEEFHDRSHPGPHLLMLLTEVETGRRWGELVALRPSRIDPARRAITVART